MGDVHRNLLCDCEFRENGSSKGSLYIGLMVNFCWFCQISMKYGKRYAQDAVEHV